MSQSPTSNASTSQPSEHESANASPLKPLLWMALLLAGLIAFGAYFN